MIQPHQLHQHHDAHSHFFDGGKDLHHSPSLNEEIKDPRDDEYNHDTSCTQYVGENAAWLIDVYATSSSDLEMDCYYSDDSLTRAGDKPRHNEH